VSFDASWIPFPRDPPVRRAFPIPTIAAPAGQPLPAPSGWLTVAGAASGPGVSCHAGTTKAPSALAGLQFENAFVWCNVVRDFFAAFGFTQPLALPGHQGTLQVRLFSDKTEIGGRFDNQERDFVPTIELFAPTSPAGLHAALDPSLLVHEYTHGVTNRLLSASGARNPFDGRQGQGLNEGYSDYFALTVVSCADRTRGGRALRRVGTGFRPGGMRDYSSFAGVLTDKVKDRYALGMVWCGALLLARDAVRRLPGVADDDAADGFVWTALLESVQAMAAVTASRLLNFSDARAALRDACTALEGRQTAFSGAAVVVDGALAARGIK
jgi:hypothetical protein